MRRVLFEHVPKCAGSEINDWLKLNYMGNTVYDVGGYDPWRNVLNFNRLPLESRPQFDLICGHHASSCQTTVQYVTAVVLRDPIERAISFYRYCQRDVLNPHHNAACSFDMGEFFTRTNSPDFCNGIVNWFGGTVEKAIARINAFDVVGFVDRLPAFAEELQYWANLRVAFEPKYANAAPTRFEPSEKQLAIVRAKNELDLELWRHYNDEEKRR